MIKISDLKITLMLLVLGGCSSKTSAVPTLDGQPRVPVNHTIPSGTEDQQ